MQVTDGMLRINEEDLQFSKQMGVTHLVTRPECKAEDGFYRFERLIQLRTRVEAAGLHVAAIHDVLPEWSDKMRQGLPGRDEQIENYIKSVTNIGRAGIPILGYTFHTVQNWRTSNHARGRGGSMFTAYDHSLMKNAPLCGDHPIDDEEQWANFEYFFRQVMPVAEAAGVKMALHPDDPPISPIAGVASIFRSVDAFQRAIDMVPSPYNGLLFCQGCYTEMLGQGVYGAIRHFGEQGKIFYVHYRNVVGQLPVFRETFVDDGDIDMLKAMRIYHETGFDGPMMPDHYGRVVGDTPYMHRSRAHAIGFMKAMMLAVGANVDS